MKSLLVLIAAATLAGAALAQSTVPSRGSFSFDVNAVKQRFNLVRIDLQALLARSIPLSSSTFLAPPPVSVGIGSIGPIAGSCGVGGSVTGVQTATGSSASVYASAYTSPSGVCSTTLIVNGR